MVLSIIGHGYVGLVTAAVFADLGNTVWCVGRTKEKIENLKKGVIPFFEPGLEEVVKKNLAAGRLAFTLSYQEAISPSEIVFICVGTPSLDNGEADLSQVFAAAQEIGKNLKGEEKIIAVKSTVPVGTTRKIAEIIKKFKPAGASFEIAFLPEFLREGTALADTLHPDRIVIGTDSPQAQKLLLISQSMESLF
ncbi:MAG: UDPglucose 6-dehydrogenase [Microgenomates group bacterium LiPW_16]|nr:MAG: UDPglucose 6-dehydrogenase [Microgenomates group bacterium LiPW_16]